MYTVYPPCRILSSYIDKYWEFRGTSGSGMSMHVLPDGCTDFIFTWGEATRVKGNCLIMQPYRSYFIGPMSGYAELEAGPGAVRMLGVRFLPCGVTRFIVPPLSELTDSRLEAGMVTSLFGPSFPARLSEKKSPRDRIALIENLLIRTLCSSSEKADAPIVFAVKEIQRSGGNLPVGTLARNSCLSQRHFERRFKICTGFSPKEYSRIVKFRQAMQLLKETSFDNLLSVAVRAGYYDVPHLCREIKKMSGCTPLSFMSLPVSDENSLIYTES